MTHNCQLQHRFFYKNPTTPPSYKHKATASPFKDSAFSLKQRELEWGSLYQVFRANEAYFRKHPAFMTLLQETCDELIQYYSLDYVPKRLQDTQEKKKQLQSMPLTKKTKKHSDKKKKGIILEALEEEYALFIACFSSTSALKKYIARSNSTRSLWTSSLSLAGQVLLAMEYHGLGEFIQKINHAFGQHYAATDFISALNQYRGSLRTLGVGLQGARFIINSGLVIKHVVQAVSSDALSWKKIIPQELEKRGFTMINDLLGSSIKLLTDYGSVFHLSLLMAPTTSFMLLMTDITLILTQWALEAGHYEQTLDTPRQQLHNQPHADARALIKRQIDVLEDEWEAQCHYYAANLFAAHLFIVGFVATFVASSPIGLALVGLLGMFANALYNCAEDYKRYQKTQIAIQREYSNRTQLHDETHHELLIKLERAADEAHTDFWHNLAYNTGAVTLLIVAAAISWPIALALTLSYTLYKAHRTHAQHILDEKPDTAHEVYRLSNVML